MNYNENEVINVKEENLNAAADPESYIRGAVDAGEIIRDTTGVTINWKQKLSSRKLWCALISAVLGVVIAIFGEELPADTVDLIEKGIYAMIAYIFGETVVDAVRVHGEAKVKVAEEDAKIPYRINWGEAQDSLDAAEGEKTE